MVKVFFSRFALTFYLDNDDKTIIHYIGNFAFVLYNFISSQIGIQITVKKMMKHYIRFAAIAKGLPSKSVLCFLTNYHFWNSKMAISDSKELEHLLTLIFMCLRYLVWTKCSNNKKLGEFLIESTRRIIKSCSILSKEDNNWRLGFYFSAFRQETHRS